MEAIAGDLILRLDAALRLQGEERNTLVHALYEDVCSPLDECALPSLDPESQKCELYYQALSLFFERDTAGSQMGWELLPIFTEMWDCADVRNTFTLVMHRWLFAQDMDICKSLNVLTKGANTLFWQDLFTLQTRYQPLFLFLAERLTDSKEANKTIDGNLYVLLVKLTARFICYYDLHGTTNTQAHMELQDLSCFIQKMEQSAWWKRCVGTDSDATGTDTAASIVVQEIAHQLEHIRSEELIAQFLLRMRSLEGVVRPGVLEITARLRLENILHGLSSPVLDGLFPTGRHSRKVVHLSFRLLNPYRWPTSLAHWTLVQVPKNLWLWAVDHTPPSVKSCATSAVARCNTFSNALLGRRQVRQ